MRIAIADDKREDGERIRDLMQARLPSAAFDLFDSGEALLKTLQPGQYDLLLLESARTFTSQPFFRKPFSRERTTFVTPPVWKR